MTRAVGVGFQQIRDAAMEAMMKSASSSNGLFVTGSYESVFYMAQCQGDLAGGNCSSCVKSAVDAAKSQCGGSITAQAYLNKCYVSYAYYPSGVPPVVSSDSGGGYGGGKTSMTVALVIGGLAAVGLLVACLLVVKKAVQKSRGDGDGGGGKHWDGQGGWR
ncbi:Plasmodesmata-located protein 2 [Linum grandiflorum]